EQVYLLWRISQQFDTIAVGMESGALEMPALVGVKTIYLERAAMRAGKAERWTYMSGARVDDEPGALAERKERTVSPAQGHDVTERPPGPVRNFRRQQFEGPTEWLHPYTQLTRALSAKEKPEAICPVALGILGDWLAVVNDYAADMTATSAAEVDWIGRNEQLGALLLEAVHDIATEPSWLHFWAWKISQTIEPWLPDLRLSR